MSIVANIQKTRFILVLKNKLFSIVIPANFHNSESCDFCYILENSTGNFYENVTMDLDKIKKEGITDMELLQCVRQWNNFNFFEYNTIVTQP